jgi:hypothetical protein
MKKLLLTLITITTLIACKKNEPIEPKQNQVVTCKLEGTITKKDYNKVIIGYGYTMGANGQFIEQPYYEYTYYIIAQYGKLTPIEIKLDKIDWDKYNVNDKYCLD